MMHTGYMTHFLGPAFCLEDPLQLASSESADTALVAGQEHAGRAAGLPL